MKRFLLTILVLFTMICSVACTSSEQVSNTDNGGSYVQEQEEKTAVDNDTTTKDKGEDMTQTNQKSETKNPPKTYAEPEQKEEISTTIAVSNAIIIDDNHHNNVTYKKKCDNCGYIEPGTYSTAPGSMTGGFYCPDCEQNIRFELQTTYSYR